MVQTTSSSLVEFFSETYQACPPQKGIHPNPALGALGSMPTIDRGPVASEVLVFSATTRSGVSASQLTQGLVPGHGDMVPERGKNMEELLNKEKKERDTRTHKGWLMDSP